MNINRLTAELFSIALSLFVAARAADGLKTGEAAPNLQSFSLEGTLPEMNGKVVLIDVFASWCGPCKSSFPAMEQLYKNYSAKGLTIVAVSVDKKRSDLDTFLKKNPVSFAVLRDPDGKLASAIGISTMPSSLIVDRKGIVRAIHSGFHGGQTIKEYETEIEALLK